MSKETEQFYATGRRKSSVARVFLRPGKGDFIIKTNKKKTYSINEFFGDDTRWLLKATKPLAILDVAKSYDVYTTVSGGGISGQSEAICLGIARALDLIEQSKLTANGVNIEESYDERHWHIALRKEGLLTRDARSVLRKLYGLVKSRKAKQFSKR